MFDFNIISHDNFILLCRLAWNPANTVDLTDKDTSENCTQHGIQCRTTSIGVMCYQHGFS